MSNITQIDFASVPTTIKLLEKDKITKKIYFKSENAHLDDEKTKEFADYVLKLPYDEYITIAKGISEELKIIRNLEPEKMQPVHINLFKNNSSIASTSLGGSGLLGVAPHGSFLVEFDEPVTISNSRSSYIYYEEYNPIQLKPMPKIDKLIDSSSFENVSTKLQEINNLLKVSSDNLKTIMDANNLMYEPTDNFSTLVQKLNSEPYSMLIDGTSFQKKILQIMDNIEMADYFTIYFLDSSKVENNSIPSSAVDVSKKQDGSIKMYTSTKVPVIKNSEKFIDYESKIYIISDKKIMANEDCSNMFAIHYHIDNIYFYNFNTSKTINMSNMFDDISSQYCMTTLNNTENFNTNSALNMDNMFKNAVSISGEITISNTNISYNNIFTNCSTSSHDNLILNYINEETKALAEQMIATKSPNSKIKLGTLVTQ